MNERKIGCTACGAGYLEALGPFLMRCDFCSALSSPTNTAVGVEADTRKREPASEPAPAPLPLSRSTALLTLQMRGSRG